MTLIKKIFRLLPDDIMNYILLIAGYHKLRNGKFIVQLDKNNPIFLLLREIPLIDRGQILLRIGTFYDEEDESKYRDKVIAINLCFGETGVFYHYTSSWYENHEGWPNLRHIRCIEHIHY